MYKTILLTLSALSIVTITASAGFAQSTSTTDCAAPWNQNHEDCTVSTKIWLDDFTSPIKSIGTIEDGTNQFLEFGTNGFNNAEGNLIFTGNPKRGELNLEVDVVNDDDTMAKKTIGGVLFYHDLHMASRSYLYYAGIKSGTNLGRPLTEGLVGVSWSDGSDTWIGGKFKVVGGSDDYDINKDDFELTVTFGGVTDAGKVGSMSALVQQAGQAHYRIDGKFDSKGVITGKVIYGLFNASSKLNPYTRLGRIDGTLSGLIGDKGAVGVFYSKTDTNSYGIYGFSGGFVVNSNFTAGEADLFRKCESNPFNNLCSDTKYDSLKIARIEHCVTDDNSVTDVTCVSAIGATRLEVSCILNPFQTACADDPDYAEQYVAARTDRVVFCDSSVNSESDVCKGGIVTAVCPDDPFHAICGDDFEGARNTAFKTCFAAGNCAGKILARPNAAAWVNTVTTREENRIVLDDGRGVISSGNRFLKNIESARTNRQILIDIDPYYYGNTYRTLNLGSATFNGRRLGGDTEDGMVSFSGKPAGPSALYYYYVGISSTTDLGAPVTDEKGTASWLGSFINYRRLSSQDFILEVNFESQSIEAILSSSYLIRGDYDDNGVISGTVGGSPLTGLIGKEGAVGAFIGRVGYGSYSGGFVARPADVLLDRICEATPFNRFCYLRPDVQKKRIEKCITGENVLNDAVCKVARGYHFCIRYPFDQECKTVFADHYELARERRSAFCNDPANTSDNFNTLCTGAEQVALCSYNPFHRLCDNANGLYNDARVAVCKSKPDSPECVAIVTTICDATNGNIYHPSCDAAYDATRLADLTTFCESPTNKENNPICVNEQVTFCSMHANAENIACAGNLPEKVTAISWLSGTYKDTGVLPQAEPDTIRPRDQFLQGTTDGVNTGGAGNYGENVIVPKTLNLNTATFDGWELDGDAADGVAFFYGANRKRYAGIFSGTDLGEPVTETEGTAKWLGQFQFATSIYNKRDFTLDMTFGAGDRAGSVGKVEAFVRQSGSTYYYLKGDFDANGVISGTVDRGIFESHKRDDLTRLYGTFDLTGLIGQEGAVGVFVGSYYGGFVASPKATFDPNVKLSDWVRSFGFSTSGYPLLPTSIPYNETQQARFLQGGEGGLFTRYLYDTVPRTLTLRDVNTDGEVADGVAYVSGTQRRRNSQTRLYETKTHHYAGILSGTHLGAALPTVPASANGAITAIWKGRLGLIADGSEVAPRDIDLTVDFTNKRISHKSEVGGKHLVNFSATWNSGVGYDGVLDGVFTGEITYDKNPTSRVDDVTNEVTYTASDGSKSEGIVTGLIGQQGAVGAFISNEGSLTPYAGGFVAAPVVSYANWVHSFDTPLLSSPTLTTTTLVPTLKNQFLKDGGTDLSTGDFKDIKPGNLNLKDTTSGDTSLGGQDTDGVDFSRGTRKAGTEINKKFFYAEILSGTNLGQPITDNSLDGSWLGIFESINHTGDARTVDFMLNVSFGNAGDKAGSINAVISGIRNEYNPFKIIGTFDANGVISGDVIHNGYLFSFPNHPDGPGTLTGLIGQDGAVGAFISTATGDDGYVGGFVAAPHVTETSIGYMDWVNSFDTPLLATPSIADNPKNRFLKDGGTDLSTDDFQDNSIADIVTGNLNLATAAYDGTLLDVNGSAADGVAFSKGTPKTKSIRRFYAEILSGTNLGQPITDGTKDGIWKGSLGFIGANENARTVDLDLNVSFGSTASNAAGDINATINPILDRGNPFILTGTFNNRGVIKGTTSDLATRTPNGTLTGLIGQQGAVGAFISGALGVYSGGFVAVPPSE